LGTGFYWSNDPTNGVKTLKEDTRQKLNQIQQNTKIHFHQGIQITQNKINKLNPGSVASYDLRPGNGVGLF